MKSSSGSSLMDNCSLRPTRAPGNNTSRREWRLPAQREDDSQDLLRGASGYPGRPGSLGRLGQTSHPISGVGRPQYKTPQTENQNIRFEKTTPFAAEADYELQWTDAAQQRLQRVPSFARGMVTKSVEKYAREHGYNEITPEIMKAVKDRFDKTGIPSFTPRR